MALLKPEKFTYCIHSILYVLIVVAIIGLSACGDKSARQSEADGKLASISLFDYKNDQLGLSLGFPKDWQVRQDMSEGEAPFFGLSPQESADDPYHENITLVIDGLPTPMDAQKYLELGASKMKEHLKGFKRGSLEKYETLVPGSEKGGVRKSLAGLKMTYKHEVEGQAFQSVLYVFIKDQKAYVITCAALPQTFEKYAPIFDRVAASLRLNR